MTRDRDKKEEAIQATEAVLHQYNQNVAEQAEYTHSKVGLDAAELVNYILALFDEKPDPLDNIVVVRECPEYVDHNRPCKFYSKYKVSAIERGQVRCRYHDHCEHGIITRPAAGEEVKQYISKLEKVAASVGDLLREAGMSNAASRADGLLDVARSNLKDGGRLEVRK